MKEIFNKHGYLSGAFPSFEFREEQLRMAETILEQLVDSGHCMVEAGTGTGKTLAYLVPAVRYAIDHDKKIAISTETKTLQKQLVDKDLPVIRDLCKLHYNDDFSYALCLGGSNYPCRKRYEAALKTGKFHPGEFKKLELVGELFNIKKIFSSFDVNIPGYLWGQINREGDSCNSYKCPFAAVCPYQLARKEWGQANVLVMNHYLFFTNIAAGKTYLPQSDIVIFDEAQSLENIAAAQLGFDVGYDELADLLGRFYHPKKHNLSVALNEGGVKTEWVDSVEKIKTAADRFFESLRGLIPHEKNYIRVREPVHSGDALVDALKNFMIQTSEAETVFDDEHPLRIEFDIARGRLFMYIEHLASFVGHTSENYVYWIEREPGAIAGDLFLRGQPVDISDMFRQEIAGQYESCVFVSATLSIGGDFSYIAGRLGIDHYRSLSLPSPFKYRDQVVLYLAADIDDPAGSGYNEQASGAAAEIIKHLHGNCLMLFTSYKTLREFKGILSGLIDHTLHSQDDMAPAEALDRYMSDVDTVLMGTHSFWQGIDLPGDLVRGVIMMKLPFSVPDSPPVEAKMELLAARGKNPFVALQIPEAVIRFKQGFGRLIRSGTDRGIVAVLDSRIVSKPYGRVFLKAVPECRVVRSLAELKKGYTMLQPSPPAGTG